MSNLYVSRHGISLAEFQQQVQALLKIADGVHPRSTLGPVEPKVFQPLYSKSFYEKPREDILRMVPGDARSILSIGCGWGAVEAELQHRGVKVTALPLDSVIGVAAGRLGLEVVNGSLTECLDALGERRFDCVLISDLLHLQENPAHFLERCSRFVTQGGAFVIGGPNFNRAPNLVKRVLGVDGHQRLRSYEESGISLCGPATVAGHLKSAGFCVRDVRWLSHALPGKRLGRCRISLGSLTAKEWVVRARRIRPAGTSVQSPDPSGQ
jgi:SAM-dependent methyltransferase